MLKFSFLHINKKTIFYSTVARNNDISIIIIYFKSINFIIILVRIKFKKHFLKFHSHNNKIQKKMKGAKF